MGAATALCVVTPVNPRGPVLSTVIVPPINPERTPVDPGGEAHFPSPSPRSVSGGKDSISLRPKFGLPSSPPTWQGLHRTTWTSVRCGDKDLQTNVFSIKGPPAHG